MKNLLSLILFLCLSATFAQAQTVSFTPSSFELIGSTAVTRSFYDLDDVYLRYKAGKITVYEATTANQIWYGDTSEISVTGASHWGAMAAKFTNWYQHCTTTSGYRYFIPKRGVQMVYKDADASVKLVNSTTKKLLLSTAADSVKVADVEDTNGLLDYMRDQFYLESMRDMNGLPNDLTVTVGAAAGSGATATIVGTGTDFRVTLTTGTTALNSGALFTVTLPVTYWNGLIPNVTNGDTDSAAHAVRVFTSSPDNSSVRLNATATALSDATEYVWYIHVAGY